VIGQQRNVLGARRGRRVMVVLVACAVVWRLGLRAWATEVVRDGQARAVIVLAPDAHPLETEAAEDLRWAIHQATGVRLDVGPEASPAGGLVPIRIGPASAERYRDSLPADLPYDGAVVRSEPSGIDILARTPAGIANAVATILLEDLGVRMYYPDPLFEIVPEAKSVAIAGRVLRPGYAYRVWSGLTGRAARAYARRNRLTDLRVPVPHYGFGHNLANVISVAAYGKDHPEYFALRDGRREVRGRDAGDTPQPCFTHPEVRRLVVEAARRYFDEHPDRDTFSLCVNDNSRYCECPSCSALDAPYRDLPVGRQYSESYYAFVTHVAEAIARSHPGRFVGVYAYWNVEQPPRDRERLPDNVIVALTQDNLQHHDPQYRDKDRALLKVWASRVRHLHTYVYYGLGWFTPRMSPRLVTDDLRFGAETGVRAVYCEVYPFWAWCGPMHYAATRVAWDPKADVPRILDEFHRDCFGAAAPQMRAYHDACERYWMKPRPGRWFEGLDRLAAEVAMADTAVLREARGHLEAASAAADPLVRRRIEWIRTGFDFTMAVAEMVDAGRSAGAPDTAERLLASARQVEATHQVLLADPAYRHTYYEGQRFDRRCWGWLREPLRISVQARWQQMRSQPQPDAAWDEFTRKSGLADWLVRRGWPDLRN